MIAFVARRLAQSLLVLLAVGFVAFALFTYAGDPVSGLVGQETSDQERAALRERLGLNDPFPVQYGRFLLNAARGDLGFSYRHRRPVGELIAERLPATLELAFAAALLALAVGLPLGVYAGLRRSGFLPRLLLAVSLLGISLPTFLIGLLLILLFGVTLQWLPTFGRGAVVDLGWWTTGLLTASGWKSLILPAATLALFQTALIMRLVRGEVLEVMASDHVGYARARGLSERRIVLRHVLPNSLIPVITVTGLHLGSLIAFAVITESVFQWPGLGLLFLQAIQQVDIPVMASYLMLMALVFVVINLAVDLLYFALDPRLRDGPRRSATAGLRT